RKETNGVALACIGAGNYATAVLIPAFREAGANLVTIAANGGAGAYQAARKFGFASATTDTAAVLADPTVNTIAISTRHNSHAALVQAALGVGKHVFVEKPLALTLEDVDAIAAALAASGDRV